MDKDSKGILKIETIKQGEIKNEQYKNFELNLGTEKGSIFEVNSRIMKQNEVINSKLDKKNITREITYNTEAKEYTLVFTSQQKR